MEINSATIPRSKYPNAYKINAFSPILKNSHVPSKKNSAVIIGRYSRLLFHAKEIR
jgi:hypothetical protein